MRQAVLSPDGGRIAALLSGSESSAGSIGVWTLADGPDQEPLRFAGGNIESFRWAGDNKLLVTTLIFIIRASRGAIYLGPARRVVAFDVVSRKATPIGGEGVFDDIIHIDPAGRSILLATQEGLEDPPGVRRIDLETGTSTEVEAPRRGVWRWHADRDGVVRVGIESDNERTRIHYRDAAGQPLRRIQPRRNLGDRSTIDEVQFLTDRGRALMLTNAQTGRFAIYEYDFTNDVLGTAVFEHPEVDVDDMIIGAGGALEGASYNAERPAVHWLDPAIAEVQAAADRTFRGKINVIVNRSRDGNRSLIYSYSATDPGTYYVYDRAGRRMEIFAAPYESLQGAVHAETRPITFRSRDGLTIHGYVTLPSGRGERNLPLVLLPHGGPFLRDTYSFNPDVQFLASRGYAVLQVNFRGSTGYGRDFVARGYGQLGGGMIDDMEDGVDHLVSQGIVDRSRVCIMGFSYGGYAATWAAMRSPDRYRCAISWAGPSDLRSMLRHSARGFNARRYSREYRRQIEGDPPVNLEALSPARQAARLRVPALIGHGEADPIVPVDQSRSLIQALTSARAANVESVFYKNSAHDFGNLEERTDFLRRVEGFLARHNPADPPATAAGVPLSTSSR